ncbi:MATE family efflux transporter [Vibrio cyclitrophicus]|uniref:MATE family efflux transporter n=1 Tax=Vibrio cyclitrophicus TaxID=47951 RepID=UPI000C837E43|nr:MATE family efflux transporter [Vibrio cyclitrophicus]PME67313.1 hypothetical protein BCV31_11060 [Vibrio cyclitrophicus]
MNISRFFLSVGSIKGISAIFQIVFVFLINNNSSVTESSLYLWGFSAMIIFSTLIKLGLENYIISSKNNIELESKINVSSCFSLISISWVLFCVPFYFIFRNKLDVTPSILFVISTYLFSLVTFCSFVKQSEREFKQSAFLLNGQFYLLTVLSIYTYSIFKDNMNIYDFLLVTILSLIIISFYNVLPVIIKYFHIKDWDLLSVIKKAKFFYITSVISILMNWLPPFYAIYVISDSDSIADIVTSQRVAIGVSFTLTIVNSFLGPLISNRISSGDISGAKLIYRKSLVILFITSTPIMVLSCFYIKEISTLFSVSDVRVLLVLVLSQYFNSICGPVGVFLNMSGNSKYVTLSSGVSLVLGFISMSILGESYSSYGISISIASMILMSNFISLFWMYNIFYVKNSSCC